MAAPKKEEIHRDHAEKLAFLTASTNERLSVQRLNELLGIEKSKAYFTRRYQQAIEEDALREKRLCTLSAKRKHELEVEFFHHNLDEPLQIYGVRALHVIPVSEHTRLEDETQRWCKQVEDFGSAAASVVLPYLHASRFCGVNFGRQLASLARGIRTLRHSSRLMNQSSQQITLVPCWGDALLESRDESWSSSEISASGIASSLHRSLNGKDTEPPFTLHAVPVFRPARVDAKQFASALSFHAKISNFIDIFGESRIKEVKSGKSSSKRRGKSGKVWNLDCILAGIGGTALPGTIFSDAFYRLAQIDNRQQQSLMKMVCGDIGGVLLREPGTSQSSDDLVSQLVSQWTCIDEEMLADCAAKGRGEFRWPRGTKDPDRSCVGTICVATGASRASPLIEAIKKRLVNIAIVDKTCVDEMDRLRDRLIPTSENYNYPHDAN